MVTSDLPPEPLASTTLRVPDRVGAAVTVMAEGLVSLRLRPKAPLAASEVVEDWSPSPSVEVMVARRSMRVARSRVLSSVLSWVLSC